MKHPFEKLYDVESFAQASVGADMNKQDAAVKYVEDVVQWLNTLGINNLVLIPCKQQYGQ